MVLVFNYSKKDHTSKRNLKTYFSLKVSNPEAFFQDNFRVYFSKFAGVYKVQSDVRCTT